MAGKFEVYKDKAGEYRFRLKAGNGEIILVGESYKAKTGVMNGIESIRENATDSLRSCSPAELRLKQPTEAVDRSVGPEHL